MTDKIEVKTRFNADIIETSTMFHRGLRYDDIAVKVIKLQEQGVIEALKHLGWNPPSDRPKIKMAKEPPSKAGYYFHMDCYGPSPTHVIWHNNKLCAVIIDLICDEIEYTPVSEVGGYWAKVEPSQFYFED